MRWLASYNLYCARMKVRERWLLTNDWNCSNNWIWIWRAFAHCFTAWILSIFFLYESINNLEIRRCFMRLWSIRGMLIKIILTRNDIKNYRIFQFNPYKIIYSRGQIMFEQHTFLWKIFLKVVLIKYELYFYLFP